jgi:NitT/TauT family transport system permease protein
MQQILPVQAQRSVRQQSSIAGREPLQRPTLRSPSLHHLGLPLAMVLLLVGWQMLVVVGNYKPFILPSPITVFERLVATSQSGLLWQHTSATLGVALGGFGSALLVAIVLGYILAHTPWMERTLAPVLAASQAIPILAVAPLIVLWFNTGWNSKVLVAALITFFPMLLSTVAALHSVPTELKEMARISGANNWQVFRYVEIPLALPVFFGGVRTGLSLATTGAVVAEFVAGRQGLGALITIARGLFDTPLIFVSLIMLAGITLLLSVVASLLERVLVQWEP